MPQWDLSVVLAALIRPPFTDGAINRLSDDVIDLKWQTLKTTFLLSLATARRRSYLHALCVSTCLFTRGDVQNQLVVNLLPQAGFFAKNQVPDQALQWIRVPGIAHLNPSEPERMLCPVRQLQLYLQDTQRIRGVYPSPAPLGSVDRGHPADTHQPMAGRGGVGSLRASRRSV